MLLTALSPNSFAPSITAETASVTGLTAVDTESITGCTTVLTIFGISMPNLSFKNVAKLSKIPLTVSVMPCQVSLNQLNTLSALSVTTFQVSLNKLTAASQLSLIAWVVSGNVVANNSIAPLNFSVSHCPMPAKNFCPSSVNKPQAKLAAAAIPNAIGEKITPNTPVMPLNNSPPKPEKTATIDAPKEANRPIIAGNKPAINPVIKPLFDDSDGLTSLSEISFNDFLAALSNALCSLR